MLLLHLSNLLINAVLDKEMFSNDVTIIHIPRIAFRYYRARSRHSPRIGIHP